MSIWEILTCLLSLFSTPGTEGPGNILEVAKAEGASVFVKYALKSDWIRKELQNGTGYTVLVPTDHAFDALPETVKAAFQHDKVLEWYLRYHLGISECPTGDMTNNFLLPSAFKPPQETNLPVQQIRFNKYNIRNGETGTATAEGGGSVTVNFHQVLTASGAEIQKADIPASNGLVHIIGKVMYPIPTGSNIPQFLAVQPQLSTLNYYLKNSSIIDSLGTDPSSPLTLFAPTDAAFGKLTDDQKAKLQDKKKLSHILTYHVIQSALYNAGMYDNQFLKALSGDKILIEKGIGGTSVAGKMISNFDITITNGVIHEMSEVMFPPGV